MSRVNERRAPFWLRHVTVRNAVLLPNGLWAVFDHLGRQVCALQREDTSRFRKHLARFYRGPVEMGWLGHYVSYPNWVR